MIKGIGIDIIELKRIEQAVIKNPRFVKRILSAKEQEEYNHFKSNKRKIEYLAGRFAAKEAFGKATGQGIGKHIRFTQIEVVRTAKGAPILRAKGYEHSKLFVSISHSESYVVAQVMITTD